MGLFDKLFGRGKSEEEVIEAVEHHGFLIYADAIAEGGQFRVAGKITKEIDGEVKEHQFIRSDVLSTKDEANECMIRKAKMFIDQSNGEIFQ